MFQKKYTAKKLGLIFGPNKTLNWATNSFLTPTAILLNDDIIRVFGGMRDNVGISRIGYVDISSDNPTRILNVSQFPCLDIGKPGTFDDNGVMPGEIIKKNNKIFLYYVGYQLVDKIKFQAFTGLAISEDNGQSFSRLQETPILDRSADGLFIRTIHTVIRDENVYKVWYVGGSKWINLNDTNYASYEIYYTESKNGVDFDKNGEIVMPMNGSEGEYRIGRPRVVKENNYYEMTFSCSNVSGKTYSGIAYSNDGKNWERDDKRFPIKSSKKSWDSESISYPSILRVRNRKYIFYCGNNLGFDGFGCAEIYDN